MTFLPVDPAYAYDYLAILEVKSERGLEAREERHGVASMLALQCAEHFAILSSEEYAEMLAANRATFDAIEKAHRDEISASAVQLVNQRRYRAKVALQARFWPALALAERKTQP